MESSEYVGENGAFEWFAQREVSEQLLCSCELVNS